MAKGAADLLIQTFPSTLWGLIRSLSVRDEIQSETRKGLPAFIKTVGGNQIATVELAGDVTSDTVLTLSHSTTTAVTIYYGEGTMKKKITGMLASLSLSGEQNGIVEFRATAQGQKRDALDITVPSSVGDPYYLEDCTVTVGGTGVAALNFSLDLTWNLEPVWDKNDPISGDTGSYPYPKELPLKSFDGRFSYAINEIDAALDGINEVSFQITLGGTPTWTISGTAKDVEGETTVEVDGIIRFVKNMVVTSLSAS